MNFVNRINRLIETKEMSVRAFALKIGVSQASMDYYIKGQRTPSLKVIESILEVFPDLSAEWLLRGKGDMFLLPELPKEEEKPNTDMGMAYFEQLMERMKKEMKEEIIAELKNIG